jgi:hypothetical protein
MLPRDLFKDGFGIKKSGPIDVNLLGSIRDFIRNNFEKNKTINTKVGSYRLKHVIEENAENVNGYIGNGDLIASMILEGFEYKKDSDSSPNANFNLKQKTIKGFL